MAAMLPIALNALQRARLDESLLCSRAACFDGVGGVRRRESSSGSGQSERERKLDEASHIAFALSESGVFHPELRERAATSWLKRFYVLLLSRRAAFYGLLMLAAYVAFVVRSLRAVFGVFLCVILWVRLMATMSEKSQIISRRERVQCDGCSVVGAK